MQRPATHDPRRRSGALSALRQRGSVAGRLLKWLGVALLGWLLLTGVPVLLLRWLHPLTSAFMLEAGAQAWAAQERAYHTDFQWVSLEQISPYAAVAVIA